MEHAGKYLPLTGRSILVVEDDLIVAQSIKDCLQDAGAQVLIASKTGDALSVVENVDPAAAVLDVELADGDSTIICQRLNERAIPFIFCSGYDDAYVSDKWPNAIIVGKPTSEQVLVGTLVALIRG